MGGQSNPQRSKPGKIDTSAFENAEKRFLEGGGEFREFEIQEIFENVRQGARLKKDDQIEGDLPFVMAGTTNTGIVGKIGNPDIRRFPKNSLTVDIFGNTFYRNFEFGASDDVGVYWNTKKQFSKESMIYISSALQKSLSGRFSFGMKLRASKSLNLKITLPTEKSGKIAFKFMEERIKELEHERIKELEAYLTVTGLKDTALTTQEARVLADFENMISNSQNPHTHTHTHRLMKFKLNDLFESQNGDFDIKKEHISGEGEFVVTAGLTENGILGKTNVKAKIFEKNTITTDMFGNSFLRNHKYKMVTHARVFSMKPFEKNSTESGLFLTGALHYLNQLFGYENMCSWAKIKDFEIQLPAQNNQPDFEFMEIFIRAVEKLAIADVVAWLDAQIETTKQVVFEK